MNIFYITQLSGKKCDQSFFCKRQRNLITADKCFTPARTGQNNIDCGGMGWANMALIDRKRDLPFSCLPSPSALQLAT